MRPTITSRQVVGVAKRRAENVGAGFINSTAEASTTKLVHSSLEASHTQTGALQGRAGVVNRTLIRWKKTGARTEVHG